MRLWIIKVNEVCELLTWPTHRLLSQLICEFYFFLFPTHSLSGAFTLCTNCISFFGAAKEHTKKNWKKSDRVCEKLQVNNTFDDRFDCQWFSAMNEAITSPPSSHNNQGYLVNHSQSFNLSETFSYVYNQAVCHSFEALEHILLFVGIYTIVCLIVYLLIFCKRTAQWYRNATNVRFHQCKRALIVTAHPDDESMFFGPTIVSLTKQNCQVYILCLSNGSYILFLSVFFSVGILRHKISAFIDVQFTNFDAKDNFRTTTTIWTRRQCI